MNKSSPKHTVLDAHIAESLERSSHLKEQQVCDLRQIKRAKLWKDAKSGLFPAPIRMGVRCTRWIAGDVLDYLQDPPGWIAKHNPKVQIDASQQAVRTEAV